MGLGRKIMTLGAIAAGAVIGVLFAPKKGAQIRKDLTKEWDKGGSGVETLKSTASKMGEDIAKTSKEAYESDLVKKGKENIKKTAKETYEKAKVHAKEIKGKAKKQVTELHGKAKDTIKGACCKEQEEAEKEDKE